MLLLVLLLSAAEPNPGHLRMGLVNLRCLTSASADAAANKAAVAKNLERHLHFIDDARTLGGHVLGFELESGTVTLDQEADLHVELPPGAGDQDTATGMDDAQVAADIERSENAP